jgi:hypothetical protein
MLGSIKTQLGKLKPSDKDLRNFGILFFGFFILFSLWFLYKGRNPYGFLAAGIAFLVPGLIVPRVLAPLYKAWMLSGIVLGGVISRIVLIVLFYLVLTPVSLVLKLMGKDILDEKIEKEKNSYWKKYEEPEDKARYKMHY